MTIATISATQIFSPPFVVRTEILDPPRRVSPSPFCRIVFCKDAQDSIAINFKDHVSSVTGANRAFAVLAPNEGLEINSGGARIYSLTINTNSPSGAFEISEGTLLAERDEILDDVVAQLVLGTNSEPTTKLQSLAKVILSRLECRYANPRKKIFAPKGKLSPDQMLKLIKLVQSGIHGNLSLSTLAAEVHLSEFHFSRLFRASFGTSPYQFVLQAKIECAQQILRQYPKSLCQIAHSLNFTDQAHFTNVFKKITGVPPTTFIASINNNHRVSRP